MKKALILNTQIVQIVNDGDEFEVNSSMVWVDVPDETTTKDTYVNGAVVQFLITAAMIINSIETAMYKRIAQGVRWSLNNGSTVYDVPLKASMRTMLSDFTALMTASIPQTNPHGGYLYNGVEKFNIDDIGLMELATFAGAWGYEISRIRLNEIELLDGMTQQQLIDYDADLIDWSIDWSLDIQNDGKGWIDDLCKQNP